MLFNKLLEQAPLRGNDLLAIENVLNFFLHYFMAIVFKSFLYSADGQLLDKQLLLEWIEVKINFYIILEDNKT